MARGILRAFANGKALEIFDEDAKSGYHWHIPTDISKQMVQGLSGTLSPKGLAGHRPQRDQPKLGGIFGKVFES